MKVTDTVEAARIPLGKVRCSCGRVVGQLFTTESCPDPCCSECLRRLRIGYQNADSRIERAGQQPAER